RRRLEPPDAREPLEQALAGQKLHREKDRLPMAPDVEHAADRAMRDPPRELDLALEALEGAGPRGDLRPDRLQREPDAQLLVLDLVDLAHAAAAQHADDAVALPDHVVGCEAALLPSEDRPRRALRLVAQHPGEEYHYRASSRCSRPISSNRMSPRWR